MYLLLHLVITNWWLSTKKEEKKLLVEIKNYLFYLFYYCKVKLKCKMKKNSLLYIIAQYFVYENVINDEH